MRISYRIALLAVGASLSLGTASQAAEPQAVAVSLWGDSTDAKGMGIKLDRSAVKAGEVVFKVSNDALVEEHEFVVVKAPKDGKVPYDEAKRRVVESKLKSLGEVGDLKPGKSGELALTMPAGSYLLICNIKGHYMAGMTAPFTVE